MWTDGRTDRKKLKVDFGKFATPPNNYYKFPSKY